MGTLEAPGKQAGLSLFCLPPPVLSPETPSPRASPLPGTRTLAVGLVLGSPPGKGLPSPPTMAPSPRAPGSPPLPQRPRLLCADRPASWPSCGPSCVRGARTCVSACVRALVSAGWEPSGRAEPSLLPAPPRACGRPGCKDSGCLSGVPGPVGLPSEVTCLEKAGCGAQAGASRWVLSLSIPSACVLCRVCVVCVVSCVCV